MGSKQHLDELKSSLKSRYPDHDATGTLLMIALARASITAGRNLQKSLDAYELHISGFDVMATLHRIDDPRGITLSKLAQLMAVTPASITNRVDQLVSKGFIERVGSDVDRRVGYVRLTKSGLKLIEKVLPEQFANECAQFKGLKKSERKELLKLLSKLVDSLETGSSDDDD